nr:extracellular solute-binding protein [Clostridia bacterium]
MKKRILSILCLLAFAVTAASCAADTSDNSGNLSDTSAVPETGTSEAVTEPVEIQPDLPDVKFDGYEIPFLVRGESYNEWASQDIYAAEENGEPVNDAVYRRNAFLEEKYDIKIAQVGASDVPTEAKTSIAAGDDLFDVVMASNVETTTVLAAGGYIVNMDNVPYIDQTQPWWDQRSIEQLTMAGKRFYMTGDLSIMANDATWILMFNKNILESFSLDDPYRIVEDGTWTFDVMLDMMTKVAGDVNGDGIVSPIDDRVGLATHNSSIEGFFFASGANIVTKNSDDIPELTMNNERLIGVLEKSIELMANPNITFNNSSNKFGLSNHLEHLQPVFQEGRSLFYGEVVQCIIRLRAMEIDFGVLPFPKYDEEQEEYNHFIHNTACMVAIPKTNTNLERTGIILEAMAAESKYTLQPAYYDICLEGKFMRDEESHSMLDIIFSTRNYDIGYIHAWGGLFEAFRTCVLSGKTDFASSYASKEAAAISEMDKSIDIWLSVD